jgi:hypothetical protein
MDERASRGRVGRVPAQVGFFASVFAVFACGWFAMRTSDWKRILLLTALALVAGALATAFRRRTG